jgi:hypothetical protein
VAFDRVNALNSAYGLDVVRADGADGTKKSKKS